MDKTLIIFDWDDTLFPTTWVTQNNIDVNKEDDQNKYIIYFSNLDLILYKILNRCLYYGNVVIVTLASTKWVISSSNLLPNTQTLIRKNIKILSASEIYRNQYPEDSSIWKKLVFKNLVERNKVNNIISVGDSEYEFNALLDLFNNTRILKSVRFIRSPNFNNIVSQSDVLLMNIDKIIKNKNNIDLAF